MPFIVFTPRLEVLPKLRHGGIFQISAMVNLGIGRGDEHFLFDSTPQDHGGYTVYKFQLAGKWSESEKISCHAILKNLYEPKMDVILTISFNVTVEIEI